jgi:glycosyltransferase involved in cell wall biosynthesis
MRIAYVTAGAAGTICGSCLHDNTLAAALIAQGHETLLIPTYTPIRTDEPDVSQKRVFFGGINVYLQQKLALFRHTPWPFDRLLDANGLLRFVSRFAVKTRAEDLAGLTISMLKGEHGHQRKELDKLVHWLSRDVRPEIINLTAVLLSGVVRELKSRLKVPILCSLQGDDIFLEALPESARGEALALIRDHVRAIDGFIATSAYYADFMAKYVDIPREKIHVVYPGLDLRGHGDARRAPEKDTLPTIGYFARICPEKGLHILVDAFRLLRSSPDAPRWRLRISGWLGENQREFLNAQLAKLKSDGLVTDVDHVDAPDHAGKVRFLQSLDVLCVPTLYREPKGLYVLEALANGVPVVQPRHGSFPELIERTGGGLLVDPEDPRDLARGLRRMLDDVALRQELGRKGREAVRRDFSAEVMARNTVDVYRKYI